MMNASYHISDTIKPEGNSGFNLHEFRVIDNGKKALLFSTKPKSSNIYSEVEAKKMPKHDEYKGFYMSDSALQMDLGTREVEFEWNARRGGITPNESCDVYPPDPYDGNQYWDFLYVFDRLADRIEPLC